MDSFHPPKITVETIWRTVLVTDARNSSKAYFAEKADEALIRIERDRALFAQIAAEFGGEEVRDRGDGSMFAFCNPVAAVQAAMAMQREIQRINEKDPPETLRLVHRMGIHLGESKLATTQFFLRGIESTRCKLSGDIVVTATRLEEICHPGEVCFSNDVYKAVHGRIEHPFRFLDSTLKGFDRPVRCWSSRIDLDWARPLTAEEELGKQKRREERRLREKWEQEQRAIRRGRIGLRVAVPFALASIAFALFQVAKEDKVWQTRFDRAWAAITDSPAPHGIPDIKLPPHRMEPASISTVASPTPTVPIRTG